VADPVFRRDLYRGTARYYDRFRAPYPERLIDDLAKRSGADGTGRLLDLACGTGKLTFALHGYFAEAWAVDQDPGMVATVQARAEAAGIDSIHCLTGAAEDLSAPDESFDLVVIGNAFHRLPREAVAALAFRWLRPGGVVALVWGGSPNEGTAAWQRAMAATMRRWTVLAPGGDRIPPGYEQARRERPDLAVLAESGFELAGRQEFPDAREWTAEALTGYVFSTAVLSRAALGPLAPAFEADLRRELRACAPSGRMRQVTWFACELARRPDPRRPGH
jgi:ubiquinone/menaquinone biosynthesis C-methylase UbiE